MKGFLFIALIISSGVFSQGGIGFVYETMPKDHLPSCTGQYRNIRTHTGLLPEIRKGRFSERNTHPDSSFLSVTAIGEAGFRYSDSTQYRFGGGVLVESSIRDKWAIRMAGIQGYSVADPGFTPKSYFSGNSGKGIWYTDVRARVAYTPNQIFNFQAGLDHNFIGEGCRSLFLSDYGKPYPFGQIRARFWRVEYSVLYQFFREQKQNEWFLKNGATHHISFNAAKWLNLSIFESVIFQPKDTMLNRGYEVEYLNPVIFYRPQEYALGSADNVLLGVGFSAHRRSHTLYGQFLLDEFFLSEVKAGNGWWANKYGGQIGIKGFLGFFRGRVFYRLEYNAVRPYTYAHLNNGQNYGNQGMTLAHPYSSNFMEVLGELKWQYKNWNSKLFISYFLKGMDKDGFSYGGDLYMPYTMRPYDYDHHIGQGKGNNGFRFNFQIAYTLTRHGNLQVFTEHQIRYDSAFGLTRYIPMAGIRSQLWNDYRNY